VRIIQPDWDFAEKAERLRNSVPQTDHARQILDYDFRLRAMDGSVVALLLRDVIPAKLHRRAFRSWYSRVNSHVTNRPEVLGTVSMSKSTCRDGAPSGFKGVNDEILNSTPAGTALQETLGCSSKGIITPMTEKHPDMLEDNRELIELLDWQFKKHLPQFREKALTEIKKAPKQCRLLKTAFTSIYLLKSWSSRYHKDSNNLRGVLTALTPFGDFDGGELVLPRWAIAIALKPGDLLFFDPQQVHGNLLFKGKRISAAFYCARRVADAPGLN
jgi:hypothetical protein